MNRTPYTTETQPNGMFAVVRYDADNPRPSNRGVSSVHRTRQEADHFAAAGNRKSDAAADALTIAYVAIGAHAAVRDWREKNPGAELPGGDGELEFIAQAIQPVALLDVLAEEEDSEHTGEPLHWMIGCFSYDVAEEFGIRYARALLNGETVDAYQLACELVAEACV